jgi:ParB-like chromosome segregation protein Spo0J
MVNEKQAVSLKVMAEAKLEGVNKITAFGVDPRIVEVEPDFNRPISRDHVESIKLTIKAGGKLPPIEVRVEQGKIILVDGEHRVIAYCECIAEGLEMPPDGFRISAQQFRGSDADRIAHLLTSSQSLTISPLQRGIQYLKLIRLGWSNKQIADRVGRTATSIAESIFLAESNTDVQKAVEANEISASNAIKAVRQHGTKAGAVIKEHVESARLAGKAKATSKHISGSTPKNLPEAIKAEMESGGSFRAEALCPKYADLIQYLRGTAAA